MPITKQTVTRFPRILFFFFVYKIALKKMNEDVLRNYLWKKRLNKKKTLKHVIMSNLNKNIAGQV